MSETQSNLFIWQNLHIMIRGHYYTTVDFRVNNNDSAQWRTGTFWATLTYRTYTVQQFTHTSLLDRARHNFEELLPGGFQFFMGIYISMKVLMKISWSFEYEESNMLGLWVQWWRLWMRLITLHQLILGIVENLTILHWKIIGTEEYP